MTIVDYIIVGQGLAGSAVAIQLLNRKKKILVIDNPSHNNSSRIAAGLFNPVTGKNMVKTWLADIIFPYLHQFYNNAEALTGEKFFYPMALYRPFGSIEEQNEWMRKSTEDGYKEYIEQIFTKPTFPTLRDELGGVILKQCGFLDTLTYTNAIQKFIAQQAHYIDGFFQSKELIIYDNRVSYLGFEAEKLVFCEGVQAVNNQWFRNVPIRSLKGETITIKCSWEKDVILNRGVYMVPGKGVGSYRVGSTYNFKDKDLFATEEGKIELQEKLNELVRFPYEIIGQDWGVRPTTPDRRPILGGHADHKSLVIFNGLGTKGVSLAPYFSEVLIRWMQNEGTISKEVNVNRF